VVVCGVSAVEYVPPSVVRRVPLVLAVQVAVRRVSAVLPVVDHVPMMLEVSAVLLNVPKVLRKVPQVSAVVQHVPPVLVMALVL
jgi:hypothetical protein